MNKIEEIKLVDQIKNLINEARESVEIKVNTTMLLAYWNIGKVIVEYEQSGNQKEEYGRQLIKKLSKQLTQEIGRGFSVSNMQFMRRFYLEYQKNRHCLLN